MHLLGLIEQLPESRYVSMTGLPMLRAVKDADELRRLSSAAEAADAAYDDILEVPFAGRKKTEIGADLADLLRKYGHSQVGFTVVGSGPNGANPHHEIGERVMCECGALVKLFTLVRVRPRRRPVGGSGGARRRPSALPRVGCLPRLAAVR
jgi:D-alanyl-D-alanine dipeptidase